MFLSASNINPTLLKKNIYYIAATLLGIMLSLIAHVIIESVYLNWAESSGQAVKWYSLFGNASCSLHPVFQIALLVIGAIGGYSLGRMWWRLVYIDKVWAKGKFANKQDKTNN